MAQPRKTTPEPAATKHRKLAVYLKPAQADAMIEEARKRADARGSVRADVSEVIRDAVEAWLTKGKR